MFFLKVVTHSLDTFELHQKLMQLTLKGAESGVGTTWSVLGGMGVTRQLRGGAGRVRESSVVGRGSSMADGWRYG